MLGTRLLPSGGGSAFPGCTAATNDGSPLTIVNNAAHNAFPGVARMADGRLIVVYRVGTDHSTTIDGKIVGQISADDGLTWGAAFDIDNPASDARDPEVTTLASGRVLVLFRRWGGSTSADAYVVWSDDNGATWETPVALGSTFSFEQQAAKPVQLPNGDVLAPLYANNGSGDRTAYLMRSTDDGATWGGQTTIATGSSHDWTEPVILRLNDGTLHCLIRVNDLNQIYRTTSTDDGATWAAAALAFAGKGKPDHIQFPCGALLYVGRPAPIGDAEYRVSDDGGATWSAATTIDTSLDNMAYASFVVLNYRQVLCVYAVEGPDPTYTNADVKSQVFTASP